MGAVEQRRAEAPGGSDGERIAGQLVGAADRAVEELAHQHVDADQHRGEQDQRAAEPQAPLGEAPHAVRHLSMCTGRECPSPSGVGAFRPSALPTVSFHSLAHSAPQRLAQPASTAPSTSFLWVSVSSGFTATMVDLGELAHGAGLLAGVAVVGLAGRRLDGRPHLVFVGLELLEQEGLRLGIEPLPAVEVDGQHVDAPAERHRIDRLGHLGPAGGVARQAAGHAAIDHAVVERRHDFGERHADGGRADARPGSRASCC